MYTWIVLLYTWNQHNIINQLYFSKNVTIPLLLDFVLIPHILLLQKL